MPITNNNPKVDQQRKRVIETILTDRPLAYHPVLAKIAGSATSGIFIAQILYWTPRSRDADGWIYKTQDELYEETALSRREQETARKRLKQASMLEERHQRMPNRMYYRARVDHIARLIEKYDEITSSEEQWDLKTALEQIKQEDESQHQEQDSQENSQNGGISHSGVSLPDTPESTIQPPLNGAS